MMVNLPSVAFFSEFLTSSGTSANLICFIELVANSFFNNPGNLCWTDWTSSFVNDGIQSKISQLVTKTPPVKINGLEMVRFSELSLPYRNACPKGGRLLISLSVISPPAMASNSTLNPSVLMASLYWSTQSASLVLIICLAPSFQSISTCSFLLTMFNKGIFSVWQILLSILPRAEAAAVLMMPFGVAPLLLHLRQVSMKPMTVMGLMTPEAADSIGTSSVTGHTFSILATEYSAHVPYEVLKQTLFPTRCSPSGPPALITYPTPSKPPIKFGSVLQYPPSIMILSEGLIVETTILIQTWLGPAWGMSNFQYTGGFLNSRMMRAFCFWACIDLIDRLIFDYLAIDFFVTKIKIFWRQIYMHLY